MRNNRKRVIRITESELKQKIAESLSRFLNEADNRKFQAGIRHAKMAFNGKDNATHTVGGLWKDAKEQFVRYVETLLEELAGNMSKFMDVNADELKSEYKEVFSAIDEFDSNRKYFKSEEEIQDSIDNILKLIIEKNNEFINKAKDDEYNYDGDNPAARTAIRNLLRNMNKEVQNLIDEGDYFSSNSIKNVVRGVRTKLSGLGSKVAKKAKGMFRK